MATVNSKKMDANIHAMTAEQKAANITALNYIKTLASSSSIDISKWDVNKIFGGDDPVNLVTDKKILNTLFFDAWEKSKLKEAAKEPEPAVEIEGLLDLEALKKEIVEAAKKSRNTIIANEKATIVHQEQDINRRANDLHRCQLNLFTSHQRLRSLELVEDTTEKYDQALKDIQKVIQERLWVNPVYDGGFLYLNTSVNLMLHEVNKVANLDIHMDLGQLAVRLDVKNGFNMLVIPYKNNTVSGGYYHPHINPEGIICWGETLTVSQKHIANLEIDKALRLLHSILNVYNPGSPHRRLADFKINGQKLGRVSEQLKHPDKRKKTKEETITVDLANDATVFLQQGITGVGNFNDTY